MKTVVITGSSRGLGFEMAKCFLENDCNVVINGVNPDKLSKAEEKLKSVKSNGKILAVQGDISKKDTSENIMKQTLEHFNSIDIWINNAGVNQLMNAIWEIEDKDIETLLNIDLKGTIYGSQVAMNQMLKQKYGAIYNMEGMGSNDSIIFGLGIYGTSKRAVTYFTKALAKESKDKNVIVGRLSPGIMITDFLTNTVNNKSMELPDKTKKVYNILGDYPDVIAKFLVNKMLTNTKSDVQFNWLTNAKSTWRFMTAGFNKRDFFKK